MKITKEQLVIAGSHSLRLRNIFIQELDEAKKNNYTDELIAFYQKEIDEINNHLDSLGLND
jgi:hypothetical protein